MKIAELSKHDLGIVDFTSQDQTRPILTGIHVRRSGDKIEFQVTDGYIAVTHKVLAQTAVVFEPFIIQGDLFKQLKKLAGIRKFERPINPQKTWKGYEKVTILDLVELHHDRVEIPTMGLKINYLPIDGKFPDLDHLLREGIKPTGETEVLLRHPFISKMAKWIGSSGDSSDRGVTLKVNGKMRPVEITKGDTYGVIMPLKS